MCGGTLSTEMPSRLLIGLSPRVRGNRPSISWLKSLHRSIPACAGEPVTSWSGAVGKPVYPRVCGGTMLSSHDITAPHGLSPRVRGNLVQE